MPRNQERTIPLDMTCAVCEAPYVLRTKAIRKICEECRDRFGYRWQDHAAKQKALRVENSRRHYERKSAVQPGFWRCVKFGLQRGEYARMLESQDGRCAICLQFESAFYRGIRKTLAVDHDHETGHVRGLLCSNCNSAIGKLQDKPRLLDKAASYLRAHGRE